MILIYRISQKKASVHVTVGKRSPIFFFKKKHKNFIPLDCFMLVTLYLFNKEVGHNPNKQKV